MSEFTKGKWKVIQGAGIDELDVISEDKRNTCCLFGYSVSRWNEQKANARLIAAAPEMYRLLQEFIKIDEQKKWAASEKNDPAYMMALVAQDGAVNMSKELLARIDDEEAHS